MQGSSLSQEMKNIQKEGFLKKRSRVLKSWRQRWVVLTSTSLFTFKERRKYENPTEIIALKEVNSIKAAEEQTDQNFSFKLQNEDTTFFLCAESNLQKQQWIGAIAKAMVKTNNQHLNDD